MDNEEQVQFIDADEYQPTPQGAISYEQVVLQQIKRCVDEGSKEMRGGYFKQKQSARGTVEIYIEDQRQIYINSINSLYDLLINYFDDGFARSDAKFENRVYNIQQEAISLLKLKLKFIQEREINEGLTSTGSLKMQLEMQIATGMIDNESYEAVRAYEKRIEAYRYLYQELIKLYGRKRFLMAEDISDDG